MKMFKDPIVDEVRKVRQAHAAKFNYDLQAIFNDLKKQEMASERKGKRLTLKKGKQRKAYTSSNTHRQCSLA
jgi:hypothetical protein